MARQCQGIGMAGSPLQLTVVVIQPHSNINLIVYRWLLVAGIIDVSPYKPGLLLESVRPRVENLEIQGALSASDKESDNLSLGIRFMVIEPNRRPGRTTIFISSIQSTSLQPHAFILAIERYYRTKGLFAKLNARSEICGVYHKKRCCGRFKPRGGVQQHVIR